MANKNYIITLQPIAIRTPNPDCIYNLSLLRPVKTMGYEKFWSEYIDQSHNVRVCFTDDQPTLDNSVLIKAYGFSSEGWHIITSEGANNG